ncbi:protein of unknown function [Taphrina deformans PYCC 5710]|uniref:Uncharacterized protein n=1 Tax=Taphrina deformans (strain PYCC 5710 / ATCC 11124 / CBS 356.35 / IMI 108563 / JCM 9778 / NBRC 8474) TaxID=1097556 RepID=R4XH79_TAPDE|nr:protein of unknown function [Taphrina deformans PYCC 5710]|eukprot:CCG85048.1 protein of unknown function [Taphrina deformans PYCC 5710]
MSSHTFDREAAEQDLKDTAADASYHSSGTVLNQADQNSKYAHGKLHRTGSIDENTSLPTTDTTIDGAYAIGQTSATESASNYQNKFTEPESHTVGTGSRTIQELPEHVVDMGSTVQTKRTTHVLQTEADPVQYISPQGAAIGHVTSGGTTYTSDVPQVSTRSTSNHTTDARDAHLAQQVSAHAGHDGVVHHHGIVGQNQTIEPQDVKLNAGSGTAVGTSSLGMPHGTTGTTTHTSSHDATTAESPKQKEGFMSKIKHALHR